MEVRVILKERMPVQYRGCTGQLIARQLEHFSIMSKHKYL